MTAVFSYVYVKKEECIKIHSIFQFIAEFIYCLYILIYIVISIILLRVVNLSKIWIIKILILSFIHIFYSILFFLSSRCAHN